MFDTGVKVKQYIINGRLSGVIWRRGDEKAILEHHRLDVRLDETKTEEGRKT
jgi:hypothetical protein